MLRSLCLVSICALLAGCGGGGGSGWNPLGWFGGGGQRGPQTLEPKGGYARTNQRLAVPQVLSARWEPTVEGRLLVVTAIAPTKGWWDVALVTETPQPAGRVRPGPDGVLRLKLVGAPPLAEDTAARMPACASLVTRTTPSGSWGEGTLRPRSRRDRRKEVQKSVVSASPRAMPRISRRPSADTPVATTSARQTTRCPTRTSR